MRASASAGPASPKDARARWAIGVFLAARLVFCAYRAAHQSLTVDEAFTFNRFVDGDWSAVYGLYDANNHVLYSLLAKLSVRVFGASEFGLRLPSVLAGLALMVGVAAVFRRLVDRAAIVLLAVLVIGLHPLLLDFSIAARGYGLSLAAFVWALYFALRNSTVAAGVLLGLAVAAILAIAFPVLALAGAWALCGRDSRNPQAERAGTRAERIDNGPERTRILAALTMTAAAAVVAALIYSPILKFILLHRGLFYVGYPTFRSALSGLIVTSIHANATRTGIFGSVRAGHAIEFVFLPLVVGWICVSAAASIKRKDLTKLIPAATLALSVLGLAVAHRILGLPYPAERTWLYVPILFGMAWAMACEPLHSRILLTANFALAALLGLQFATQLQADYFLFWAPERNLRHIVELIQADSFGRPPDSVAISTTVWHEPAIEFYRRRLGVVALKKVERLDPPPLSGYNYYVLSEGDVDRGKQARLAPMFVDTEMGTMLARNAP